MFTWDIIYAPGQSNAESGEHWQHSLVLLYFVISYHGTAEPKLTPGVHGGSR